MKSTLTQHLATGHAFTSIDQTLDEIPYEKATVRPAGLPYSCYELLWHIRFAQKDIINFVMADSYAEHSWPDDYWPKENKINQEAWEQLKADYKNERQHFQAFLKRPDTDLEDIAKHGNDQTVFREALLILEHTAYHAGQLVVLLRLLGEKD